MISLLFGKPIYRWLPVTFRYKDFALDFEASGVLNDPVQELYHVVVDLQNNELRKVVFWCEPGAYMFSIERKDDFTQLIIQQTADLHNKKHLEVTLIKVITEDARQILEPFRFALIQFSQQTFDNEHWPGYLDQSRIVLLRRKDYR